MVWSAQKKNLAQGGSPSVVNFISNVCMIHYKIYEAAKVNFVTNVCMIYYRYFCINFITNVCN